MKWIALCVGVLSVALVDAQIFQNFFQHAGNPFFERSDEEVHSGSEPTWYQARVQHAHCDQFLCSDTLACVNEPSECPCPHVEQVRCEVGDAYVCVHARHCRDVQQMYTF